MKYDNFTVYFYKSSNRATHFRCLANDPNTDVEYAQGEM